MNNYKCRVCSVKIKELMSFGKMPIANAFVLNKNDLRLIWVLTL